MYNLPENATELDFLIIAIQKMRDMQQKPRGAIEAQKYEAELSNYFRLPLEMTSAFAYDTLLRLASLPAGSSRLRNEVLLKQIHEMHRGSYFRLQGRLCIVDSHHRVQGEPRAGYFKWHYATDFREQTISYDDAWTLAEEGTLSFGQGV